VQVIFIPHDEGDVPRLRCPTVTVSLAFREDTFLGVLGQSDIAVAEAVDVHEHYPSHEECIFVDAGIYTLCDTG